MENKKGGGGKKNRNIIIEIERIKRHSIKKSIILPVKVKGGQPVLNRNNNNNIYIFTQGTS